MSARVYHGPWTGSTAATKRRPEPPTVPYLAERVRLGIPSHAEVYLFACPWCGSRAGEACHIRATGRRLTRPHEARALLAEAPA